MRKGLPSVCWCVSVCLCARACVYVCMCVPTQPAHQPYGLLCARPSDNTWVSLHAFAYVRSARPK